MKGRHPSSKFWRVVGIFLKSRLLFRGLDARKKWVERTRERRLEEIVKFAYQNCPFYKELYDEYDVDINNFKITDLPVTDKNMIMKNFDKIVTTEDITFEGVRSFVDEHFHDPTPICFKDKYHVLLTSGTSGLMGYFISDEEYFQTSLAVAKRKMPIKFSPIKNFFKPLKVVGISTGNPFHVSTTSYSLGKIPFVTIKNLPLRRNYDEIIEELNEEKPDFISVESSLLLRLTNSRLEGTLKIKPKLIISSMSRLDSNLRRHVEMVFNSKITDVYGCSEIYPISEECEKGSHHVNEDFCYFEIVDKDLKPVKREEPGSYVLVTNFFNEVIPLIRYKIDDRVREVDCSCKSEFKAIEILDGRTDTSFIFKSREGDEFFAELNPFYDIFENIDGILKKQVVQESLEEIIVNVVYTKEDKDKLAKKIEGEMYGILKDFGANNVVVNVNIVGEIPFDYKTGKFQEFYSKPYAEFKERLNKSDV